ncbi:MAG: hypothetical protein RDU25_01520 [Patescibacteria group bacterium]|nr:hypothetical protein [Patescibacteria group bacterium]
MADKTPRYISAWSGSFDEIQSLPRAMRGVLREALSENRAEPGKFLVAMGRLIRFCDIGTPCRKRAWRSAAATLSEVQLVEKITLSSQEFSRTFSRAFHAVRYRQKEEWSEEQPASLAIILARDDLESMWQAVRHGVPIPDLVRDQVLAGSLAQLRLELDDQIQMMDALHDGALGGLLAQDLATRTVGPSDEFILSLVPVEPIRWWLSVYWVNIRRTDHKY